MTRKVASVFHFYFDSVYLLSGYLLSYAGIRVNRFYLLSKPLDKTQKHNINKNHSKSFGKRKQCWLQSILSCMRIISCAFLAS